jgi:hypothetical protein
MATIISFNRRRTQATKVAWVVVPPLDESTGLPDLPLFSREEDDNLGNSDRPTL